MTPRKKREPAEDEVKNTHSDESGNTTPSIDKTPVGSYTTEATHEITIIAERIFTGLVAELTAQGYSNPPEVAHTILKNGFNIALSSMQIATDNHQTPASNPIGFRSANKSS